ncbi:MAG: KpsF/GutQ family sugar-phosphate isomerase [Bacteroidaceae bacterium]|jgi:arabinose-5-phosphate isomerase|nr:KpsF/GutQ family sugar-phosphate isomerase [Bacteroidaceae bacterium]
MNKWNSTAIKCLEDEAEAILSLIPVIDDNLDKAVKIIMQCTGKVVITGVGKSGHIGAKIASTFSSVGTPSFYVNPLDLYHGDLGVIMQNDVVIAISNSGQTDELLRIFPQLLERRIPIIGMSGNKKSLLAKYSQAHLFVDVKKEATPLGLAPTCSTTATLALGDALACCLIKARDFKDSDFARFHPGGALGKMLLTKASDVMIKDNLPVISPDTKLGHAVILVSKGRLGICVAVEDEKVIGIVTDGDIRRAMETSQNKFFDLQVKDIMTKHPKTVSIDTHIIDIDKIMNTNKIHCVLVVDEENRLLGIVDSFSTVI